MARAKVQTSKKRPNRRKEELRTTDEVTNALQKFSEHLSQHIKLYAGGLAAVLALALVGQMLFDSYKGRGVERSNAAMTSFLAAGGTVAEFADDEQLLVPGSTPEDADKPTYVTNKARWDDALAQIESQRDAAGSDLAPLLDALKGRVQLATGSAGDAATSFAAFVSEEEDSLLLPIVIENQGRAAEADGDLAAAAGFYERLAGLSDTYYKVRGSMLLGDLYNPALRGGKGDAAKAKSHYDAALDVLVPTRGHVPNASMRGLRSEIMRRKSALGS